MLTRRDYTAAELRAKLLDREHSASDITAAIADLTRDRFVDDRRVALAFLRVAADLKGRGRHRIERELEHRGVDKAIIREALATLPVTDEIASIRRFLERKHLPDRLSPAEHRRIFGQLMRRGFSADLIATAIRSRATDDDA
ncbi:MAG: regulatory protein RecX [Acidobacteria bacterium]|nr:regulatory protein RecX [Acidobacteriota bacterium]